MSTITLTDILDDLRVADRALREFEEHYHLSSDLFSVDRNHVANGTVISMLSP